MAIDLHASDWSDDPAALHFGQSLSRDETLFLAGSIRLLRICVTARLNNSLGTHQIRVKDL